MCLGLNPAGKTRHFNNLWRGSDGGGLNLHLRLLLMELPHSSRRRASQLRIEDKQCFSDTASLTSRGVNILSREALEQVFTVMTDFCSFLKNNSAADVLTTQLLFGIGSINPTGIWTLCCSSGGGEGLSKRLYRLQASQLLFKDRS